MTLKFYHPESMVKFQQTYNIFYQVIAIYKFDPEPNPHFRFLCEGNRYVRPGVSSGAGQFGLRSVRPESVRPVIQFGLSQFGLFPFFTLNSSFYFIVSLICYFNTFFR